MKSARTGSSRPQPCSEIVIYRIKPGHTVEFDEIHGRILAEMRSWPGFLAVELAVSPDESNLRMDRLIWQDVPAARAAHRRYRDLEDAPAFMKVIDSVLFSGHFSPLMQET